MSDSGNSTDTLERIERAKQQMANMNARNIILLKENKKLSNKKVL